jgi:CDP-diacylglycerol---glycerol-3-phosphate 3-phosphatidyltransferase
MLILVEFNQLPAWIPIIVITREFIVSGYRLVIVEQNGEVIAASVWGKIKTVTQMIAIMLAFLTTYKFGAFITEGLTGINLVINILATSVMDISVIATIFSGWDYIKDWKKVLKMK